MNKYFGPHKKKHTVYIYIRIRLIKYTKNEGRTITEFIHIVDNEINKVCNLIHN